MNKFIWISLITMFASCNSNTNNTLPDVPVVQSNGLSAPANLHAMLMAEFPHDTTAFTEGLQIHNGKLFESTGLQKESKIKIIEIKSGKTEKEFLLSDPTIFGEGINIFKDKLYQLTYQNHVAYVYNLSDLSKPIKTFNWSTEGWGITNNGTDLIISDGQAQGNLYFVNPDDFKVKRIVQVVDNYGPVNNINELEYVDGSVFANVWGSTNIIKINPENGHVTGKLETQNVLMNFYSSYPIRELDNVLNGIAYDSTNKKLFITGKRWPKLFELKLN